MSEVKILARVEKRKASQLKAGDLVIEVISVRALNETQDALVLGTAVRSQYVVAEVKPVVKAKKILVIFEQVGQEKAEPQAELIGVDAELLVELDAPAPEATPETPVEEIAVRPEVPQA